MRNFFIIMMFVWAFIAILYLVAPPKNIDATLGFAIGIIACGASALHLVIAIRSRDN